MESEVASLKEVNADLHINLEKFEEQKEELSKQLQTAREGHQEKVKKITDDLEKEKTDKSKCLEVAIKLKADVASLSTTNKSLTAACTEYEENITKLKQNINQLIEERDGLQANFGNQDEPVASIAKE
jgi:chromosome segregation ATPase